MTIVEFRLSDQDRKTYATPGDPEWVPLDREALDDAPFDVLHPWEKEIRETEDTSVQKIIYTEWLGATALGIKGAVWLAWKQQGLDTPPWDEFNIRTNAVRCREVDVNPPAEGSSEPSSETEPS